MDLRGTARPSVVAGLDLGTTKVCAAITEADGEGPPRIIGVGQHPSEGLRRGVIVDVEKTVQAVGKAVKQAELMAGVEVEAVYAGIAGEHIHSFNSTGVVAVSGVAGRIGAGDRERVLEAASAVSVPPEREVLHILPQEFAVDGRWGIVDPVGMQGVRLEAAVHMVTGAVNAAQNICRSILRAGFEVRDLVLGPLACGQAVLDEEERQMGACLIDVGGGTTDVALFHRGGVRHTGVIGLGGRNVTNDLAIGLRTSWPQAERLKCQQGVALAERVGKEEMVEVPGIGGRSSQAVERRKLATIIEARMEEIFSLVRQQTGLVGRRPEVGVVLTGGGALLEGVIELAERVLEAPARLGLPRGLGGLAEQVATPVYATALGLVLYGLGLSRRPGPVVQARNGHPGAVRPGSVLGRVKEWVQTWV
jgi:cell division protein FtsA